jgi:hypothetical protein
MKNLYTWDVSFSCTHPNRPNLKTQAQTRVQACNPNDAKDRARTSLAALGWIPIEPISCVRGFRVSSS